MRRLLAALIPLVTLATAAAEEITTSLGPVTATVIADGLSNPWSLAFLPDGAVLVTERPGRLLLFGGPHSGAEISGVPDVRAEGQGGLHDIALGCDFAAEGTVFLSYAKAGKGGAGTAVARARFDGLKLVDLTDIFVMSRFSRTDRHFGARLVVNPDCSLFLTIGDRGEAPRAQDFNDHAGAVIRIDPDGAPHPANPLLEGGGRPELWSKGHRNPQGAALEPGTGALVTVEHGARGGDEVNRPQAGRNYGWPIITYGRDYSGLPIGEGTAREGLEQPLHYWDPSIAPSGAAFVSGAMFGAWQDDLLVGALAGMMLVRLERDGDRYREAERIAEGAFGRIRDVRVAADGAIWLLTDADPGQVIRLSRP